MSIRLRLTLLFSVILALTLTGFGGMLYGTQAQSMRRQQERTHQHHHHSNALAH